VGDNAAIAMMPKVELHVHLEGAARPETLLTLARRNGVSLPAADRAGLQAWHRFRDFPHFGEIYDVICDCIVTPDDLTLLVSELGADAAAQGICYLEVTTTTNARLRRGFALDDQLAALVAGAHEARQRHGVQMQFIVDIVPEQSLAEAWTLVRWAVARQGQGICALGLAGTESRHDKAALAPIFTYARDAGLPRAIHAGETMGPQSIWDALTMLHANRIGHGVRAIDDAKLVDFLVETQIPLEVCPTSNVCLGVMPSIAAHPVRCLWDAGVYLTVNTDDPPLFGVTLTDEYRTLARVHGFTFADLCTLTTNAARAAFLPPAAKAALLAEIVDRTAQVRNRLYGTHANRIGAERVLP